MKVAITGGTGFVGRHLAWELLRDGHEVVVISRGIARRDDSIGRHPRVHFAPIGVDDESKLAEAFAGCDAVAHCAGINREIAAQTYAAVHVRGTRNVVSAAKRASVGKIVLLSFLRARPGCRSGYHESKYAAEEIVRGSGLDYTVIKSGMIYGRGDHMLDHLSHAFHTFPIFGLVGFKDKYVRPAAVQDVVRILKAALVDGRLSRQSVAVLGPQEMALSDAVRRVAHVVGKKPLMIRLPLWFHYAFAWFAEKMMKIPLISIAQVRMLSEGVTEPLPPTPLVEGDLAPTTPFTEEQIRQGLPEPKPFGLHDCRCPGLFGHP